MQASDPKLHITLLCLTVFAGFSDSISSVPDRDNLHNFRIISVGSGQDLLRVPPELQESDFQIRDLLEWQRRLRKNRLKKRQYLGGQQPVINPVNSNPYRGTQVQPQSPYSGGTPSVQRPSSPYGSPSNQPSSYGAQPSSQQGYGSQTIPSGYGSKPSMPQTGYGSQQPSAPQTGYGSQPSIPSGFPSQISQPQTGGYSSQISQPQAGGYSSKISQPQTGGYSSQISQPQTGGYSSQISRPQTGGYSSQISQPQISRPQTSGYSSQISQPQTSGYSSQINRPQTSYGSLPSLPQSVGYGTNQIISQPSMPTYGAPSTNQQPYGPAPAVSSNYQTVNTGMRLSSEPLGGYCPANQVPQINPQNDVAQGCPNGGSCGAGYRCQISTTNQYLCCGYVGQCPSGYVVYKDSSGHAISCGGSASRCPYPAKCQAASGMPGFQYLCCSVGYTNTGMGTCRNGGQPYVSGYSQAPMSCNPGGYIGCPIGYSCQFNYQGGTTCCSDFSQQGYCPATYTPSFVNNQAQYCYVTLPQSCSPPYSCLQASTGVGFVCCRPGGIYPNPCSNFQNPLMINGQMEFCSTPGSLCSSPGFTCQPSTDGTLMMCCGGGESRQCSSGGQALYLNTTPFTCSLQANNCPSGYSCEQSLNGQYICCGGGSTSGTCPDRTEATQACSTLGADASCGTGRSCQTVTGANNTRGCCPDTTTSSPTTPSTGSDCPAGRLPDIQSGQPRSCTPSASNCRLNYECVTVSGGGICCQGPRCVNGPTIATGPDGTVQRCTGDGDCPSTYTCSPSKGPNPENICCPQ